jgi:hypothetical protein
MHALVFALGLRERAGNSSPLAYLSRNTSALIGCAGSSVVPRRVLVFDANACLPSGRRFGPPHDSN